jgi:alpha-L-fucosidase
MTDDLSTLFLADEKKAWFRHDRFGMFIHWGLYALAARQNREEKPDVIELFLKD